MRFCLLNAEIYCGLNLWCILTLKVKTNDNASRRLRDFVYIDLQQTLSDAG